jgi:Molybdate transporter of MFS superfamily
VLAAAAVAGWIGPDVTMPHDEAFAPSMLHLVIPSGAEVWRSVELAVLPQLSLTLTNAVIVEASLSREPFPATGTIASECNLALSSGLANVLLCPFGAMPMIAEYQRAAARSPNPCQRGLEARRPRRSG